MPGAQSHSAVTRSLAEMLKSQLATKFAVWDYCRADFSEYAREPNRIRQWHDHWQKFSKVSSLLNSLHDITVELTFQKCAGAQWHSAMTRSLVQILKSQPATKFTVWHHCRADFSGNTRGSPMAFGSDTAKILKSQLAAIRHDCRADFWEIVRETNGILQSRNQSRVKKLINQ